MIIRKVCIPQIGLQFFFPKKIVQNVLSHLGLVVIYRTKAFDFLSHENVKPHAHEGT